MFRTTGYNLATAGKRMANGKLMTIVDVSAFLSSSGQSLTVCCPRYEPLMGHSVSRRSASTLRDNGSYRDSAPVEPILARTLLHIVLFASIFQTTHSHRKEDFQ